MIVGIASIYGIDTVRQTVTSGKRNSYEEEKLPSFEHGGVDAKETECDKALENSLSDALRCKGECRRTLMAPGYVPVMQILKERVSLPGVKCTCILLT